MLKISPEMVLKLECMFYRWFTFFKLTSYLIFASIDSGLDYNHPAFVGSQTITGYDFVGNDFDPYDPNSKPKPADDFMDCNGHGTHTAVGSSMVT
jgi:hypothetical protein